MNPYDNSRGSSQEKNADDDEASSSAVEAANILLQISNSYRNPSLSLGLQSCYDSAADIRLKQYYENHAIRLKQDSYKSAKNFALELHSDISSKIVEEDEVKGNGKSQFWEAREAIKIRRDSISTTTSLSSGFKLNLSKKPEVPTLVEITARVLSENSESIKSLKLVPDHLKRKISNLVCDLDKFSIRFMQLLIEDSPCEIFVKNCVELEEKDLLQILCDCDKKFLEVLVPDFCGRAMIEYTIIEFFKRSPDKFQSLKTLSFQGAFCLTYKALSMISTSSPLLQFINLSYCSLLSSQAVKILVDNFGSTLRALDVGGCQGIKPSIILKNSLLKFKKLNYLSVAVLENIVYHGLKLTDLSLNSCKSTLDSS